MKIGNFEITNNRTFIIAEVGNNHNGSFELANIPSVEGSGVIVSQSNQISGWGLQFTGSAGNVKLETGTTYPSASVIAVDGSNVIVVVNAAGVAT